MLPAGRSWRPSTWVLWTMICASLRRLLIWGGGRLGREAGRRWEGLGLQEEAGGEEEVEEEEEE
eukprot:2300158-Pyramimonas_sp.AAC.1